jgi:hypothetical protein
LGDEHGLIGVHRRRECRRREELPHDGRRDIRELVGPAGDLGRALVGVGEREPRGGERDVSLELLVLRPPTKGGKPRVPGGEMRTEVRDLLERRVLGDQADGGAIRGDYAIGGMGCPSIGCSGGEPLPRRAVATSLAVSTNSFAATIAKTTTPRLINALPTTRVQVHMKPPLSA